MRRLARLRSAIATGDADFTPLVGAIRMDEAMTFVGYDYGLLRNSLAR
jgi:hypothetical protein